MAKTQKLSKDFRWWSRVLASYLLAVLASCTLTFSIAAHYINDNIINTEGYIKIITPLPKNDSVAQALSITLTDSLFEQVNVTESIKEFLPPKLAPIASPISKSLQEQITKLAKSVIQSDDFTSAWILVNTKAQSALLKVAESKPDEQTRQQRVQNVVAAGDLLAKIRSKLSNESTVLSDTQKDSIKNFAIDTQLKVDTFRQTVRIIKSSAATLPFVFIALILASVAIAISRRRAIIVNGLLVASVGIIALIVAKIASGEILGEIGNSLNRAAAEVIYEAFYAPLRTRVSIAIISGLIVSLVAFLLGPSELSRQLQRITYINRFGSTKLFAFFMLMRTFLARYYLWLVVGGLVIMIAALLLISEVSIGLFITIISLFISYCALLSLGSFAAADHKSLT